VGGVAIEDLADAAQAGRGQVVANGVQQAQGSLRIAMHAGVGQGVGARGRGRGQR